MAAPISIAIVTTHPIQYQAPWFRALAAHPAVNLTVTFCHRAQPREQGKAGFGVNFDWDIPLLDGYQHVFLPNVARQPRLGTFAGLDTPRLYQLIRPGAFHAVVVNGWNYKSAWQAITASWKARIPVMVRGDSNLHTSRSPAKQAIKRLAYRLFVPRLDACLAVGSRSRDYFVYYGAKPSRVHIVPHVVDPARFSTGDPAATRESLRLREQWGFLPEQTVFLFAGKFIPEKCPLDFVRAIGQAAQQDGRIAGVMVGDGDLRPACEAYVRDYHVPIHFAGFLNQSEIPAAYGAADALVLPSVSETWGMVVNEAMACGRPCVVSDAVGSGPDMVFPGRTGAVYPLGDVTALADRLVSFTPEDLRRMGLLAADMARRYTPDAAATALLRAVEAVSPRP